MKINSSIEPVKLEQVLDGDTKADILPSSPSIANAPVVCRFISFSGGVESRTMAILFGNKADAIFADTKAEHDKLYECLNDVEQAIKKFHNNNFKIHRVVSEKHPEGLMQYIKGYKFFPSFNSRYCTRIFKIEPIDNFLSKYDSVELMIGLNADEADLRTGNHGLMANVNYSYPLIEHGIDREMCYEILAAAKLETNFPPYMKRGGCKCCFYKSKKEFEAMAILNEKEYDEVAELEQEIQDKRDKFFHLITSIPNMKDFKKKATSILFKPDEIFSVKNDVTNCGVFCNR